jgi:hypothetical protein
MNFDFYIFKSQDNEYDQFPLNQNSELFKEFVQNHKGDASLTIYRSLQLTYYTYIQETEEKEGFFGISLVFNGVYCGNTEKIFKLFEDAIANEVTYNQKLFHYTENGKIIPCYDKLYLLQVEIDNLRHTIRQNINIINSSFAKTDEHFEQGNNATKELALFDGNAMINAAIRKYQQVLVTRDFVAEKRKRRKKRIKYSAIIIAILLAIILGGIAHLQHKKAKEFKDFKAKTKEYIQNKDINTANSWYKKCVDLNPKDEELQVLKAKIDSLIGEEINREVESIFNQAKNLADFAAKQENITLYPEVIILCQKALLLQDTNSIIIQFRDSIKKIIK